MAAYRDLTRADHGLDRLTEAPTPAQRRRVGLDIAPGRRGGRGWLPNLDGRGPCGQYGEQLITDAVYPGCWLAVIDDLTAPRDRAAPETADGRLSDDGRQGGSPAALPPEEPTGGEVGEGQR